MIEVVCKNTLDLEFYMLLFKYLPITFANLQQRVKIDDIKEDEIIFVDLETGMEGAPYTAITQIGVKYGFEGKAEVLRTKRQFDKFRDAYSNPDIIKVGFNNCNFDDIVLKRHGYKPSYTNLHDGYLMAKAVSALLPSYSLKFICWYFLGDHHFAEGKVDLYKQQTKDNDFAKIPPHLLNPYHEHDLDQHADVFRLFWEKVQEEPHWSAYMLDLSVAPAVQQMILEGGLDIDLQLCNKRVVELETEREMLNLKANLNTEGYIQNLNSSRQVADWLDVQGFEMALTENGEWSLGKDELVDLKSKNPIAQMMYRVREINGTIKYFKAYKKAAEEGEVIWKSNNGLSVRIPRSYSISNARSRRFTSSSRFGINFQNTNQEAQQAHLVPDGWVALYPDLSQVENVVHIYESEDSERRRDYESNPLWNEYVWLGNKILRSNNLTKEILDEKDRNGNPTDRSRSKQIPHWTIYKQYKTAKLGLNFGMGEGKFGRTNGLSPSIAHDIFEEIHDACPAIRFLINKVARKLRQFGFVQDVFGHIYSGPERKAYKVVAYLIQGCGTASLPKAIIKSHYDTLQRHRTGLMCGTTHDDFTIRLDLRKKSKDLIATLQELMYNMTKRFSPRFDNIPLRAKMYMSRTRESEKKEVNLLEPKSFEHFLQ